MSDYDGLFEGFSGATGFETIVRRRKPSAVRDSGDIPPTPPAPPGGYVPTYELLGF